MDVKNLSWEQIKELAEMAMKNENDFSLTLCADGDCSLDISKHDYSIAPITTSPSIITWNNPPAPIKAVNIGDVLGYEVIQEYIDYGGLQCCTGTKIQW